MTEKQPKIHIFTNLTIVFSYMRKILVARKDIGYVRFVIQKKNTTKMTNFAKNNPPAPVFYAFSMQKSLPRAVLTLKKCRKRTKNE
jgi:hypothetical protein